MEKIFIFKNIMLGRMHPTFEASRMLKRFL